jgi:hypothetical protein
MKIKSQSLIIIGIICVAVILGIWYFATHSKNALSSQSIDVEEGTDPRPAILSLDGTIPAGESVGDTDTLIEELQQELLKTENDPDRALELRRRIQALKNSNQTNDISVETKI